MRRPVPKSGSQIRTAPDWRGTIDGDRVAHLVRGTHRGFVRALQMRLAKLGVAHGHWTFLRVLWRMDGLTQRQLSEQAGVMDPTTFAAVKAMEKLGYVTRQRMPGNRKEIRVLLTPKGAALRALLTPMAEEVNNLALAGISPEDIAITRRTLAAMNEALDQDALAALEDAV